MSNDSSLVGGSAQFNLADEQGVTQLLLSIRAADISSAQKNEIRDLVFLYANGGRDESVRITLEQKISAYGVQPVATPEAEVAETIVHPFGASRPAPAFTVAAVPTPVASAQQPATTPTAPPVQSQPVQPPQPAPAPVVPPENPPQPQTVPTPPVQPAPVAPPVSALVPPPTQPASAPTTPPVAPPQPQPQPQPQAVPADPGYDPEQNLRRIRQIKSLVNEQVGNPVNLIDINNEVGREYMSALLDAMKKLNSGSSVTSAMLRLENAYTAVDETLANHKKGGAPAVLQEAAPIPVVDAQPQPMPVAPMEPAPVAPPAPAPVPPAEPTPPPVQPTPKVPVAPAPREERAPSDLPVAKEPVLQREPVAVPPPPVVEEPPVEKPLPQQNIRPTLADDTSNPPAEQSIASDEQRVETFVPHTKPEPEVEPETTKAQTEPATDIKPSSPPIRRAESPQTIASAWGPATDTLPPERQAEQVEQPRVASLAATKKKLRNPSDLQDPASLETSSVEGDPLFTREVDDGLNQLLSEWPLFKKSGLFGTGPKGREHPLFKKIAGLQIPLLLAGRFEGATQEIKQSITDYMNGWRYEQGIIYDQGETFEHYLRRVIRHILDLQNRKPLA